MFVYITKINGAQIYILVELYFIYCHVTNNKTTDNIEYFFKKAADYKRLYKFIPKCYMYTYLYIFIYIRYIENHDKSQKRMILCEKIFKDFVFEKIKFGISCQVLLSNKLDFFENLVV